MGFDLVAGYSQASPRPKSTQLLHGVWPLHFCLRCLQRLQALRV